MVTPGLSSRALSGRSTGIFLQGRIGNPSGPCFSGRPHVLRGNGRLHVDKSRGVMQGQTQVTGRNWVSPVPNLLQQRMANGVKGL